MPSSLDNKDVLYLSTREILDFSENWKTLYQPFPWPNSVPNEPTKPSITDYCIDLNDVRHSRKPYYSTDCFLNSNFIPNIHSTPNKVTNQQYNKPENLNFTANTTSVQDMSFSTTYPGTSLSAERCQSSYESAQKCVDRCASLENINPIPSISGDVDSESRHKFTCNEIYCERNKDRRVRKTGIKGVRCIVSFALTDDPVKKRTQIQACSISIMILAIISISFILVYFFSDNYNVSVPTIHANVSANKLHTERSTVRLPSVYIQRQDMVWFSSSTSSSTIITQLLNDAPASENNATAVSDIIQKIQKNIKSYPKNPRRSELLNASSESAKSANESRHTMEEFCNKCQKDTQVCMLNEESGIPVCINVVDRHDPTGCGGLCALETEACQVVDRARGVRICRALTSMRCTAAQWQCHNELCVSRSARCDGRVDCYDRSDEMHCDCDLSKHFRCGHSTSCFPNTKLCDGHVDCWDGRDEVNCTITCPHDEFMCNNGQCIATSRFCDGFADCSDSSDEPSGCDKCQTTEIRCSNGRCIGRTLRCDGIDHCGDRTDEKGCLE